MFPRSHVLSLVTWPIMWLAYLLFHNLISSIPSCYAFYIVLVSSDNKSTSPLMRSVTLPPLSPSLSLKTFCISKLLIRGVVFPDSICLSSFLTIPPIRSSASFFIFFFIHCIILCTILRRQPLGYGAIVLYTWILSRQLNMY